MSLTSNWLDSQRRNQLERGWNEAVCGMTELPLGSYSRILEDYWEKNNLLSGKSCLKTRFLPQVNVAMVINGEFLVSKLQVDHGGPRHLGGTGRSSRLGMGVNY